MAAAASNADLQRVRKRIRQKEKDFVSYNFSPAQSVLLRTFFDLAQEFDSIQDFYQVCVAAPQECMGLESDLYLFDDKNSSMQLVCSSRHGVLPEPEPLPARLHIADVAYETESEYVVPIHSKAVSCPDETSPGAGSRVMGLLVVSSPGKLSEADRFFLSKYTNRIGIHLHNRLLALQNIQHLKFINGLVMDIEHNVIVPNMYFRHLFNNLKKSIAEMEEIEDAVAALIKVAQLPGDLGGEVFARLAHLREGLLQQHHELQEHHAATSLFLESLFRRDHFVQGHLVLRPRYCRVEEEIIAPQLARFASRFAVRGITLEAPTDMGGEGILLVVDVGLLSQVYANFFSNALKYVEEVIDHRGQPRKAVAYGREFVPDYFGPDRPGIKFNVFTTGPHLTPQEAEAVFAEGYRGAKFLGLPGSGHGLAFVKQIVEIHGGVVGYEATDEGNNFYFILPLPEVDSPLAEIIDPPASRS